MNEKDKRRLWIAHVWGFGNRPKRMYVNDYTTKEEAMDMIDGMLDGFYGIRRRADGFTRVHKLRARKDNMLVSKEKHGKTDGK